MISTEKQTLRLRMQESLRAMTDAERSEKSLAIAKHLAVRLGVAPGLVFGFAPLRREPDWTAAIGPQWRTAFPQIAGRELRFVRVEDLADLVAGSLGAREPVGGEAIPFHEAAVVLVPGVAFDRAGARIGRGGGFYDRFLGDTSLAARRIAICYACQIVDRVPVEPHDVEVEAIVTEDGWLDVRSSGRGRD